MAKVSHANLLPLVLLPHILPSLAQSMCLLLLDISGVLLYSLLSLQISIQYYCATPSSAFRVDKREVVRQIVFEI